MAITSFISHTVLRSVFAVALVLGMHEPAFATWSVIAVDRSSGTVVIASATCVLQASLEKFPAKDLRDIQAIVVPGIGVAAAQAARCCATRKPDEAATAPTAPR